MKNFLIKIAIIFLTINNSFSSFLRQVPKALDLLNHFGSETKQNYYGPHHLINRNSFLINEGNYLSNFADRKRVMIVSGNISDISNEAENVINPLLY